jgi:hypothetical protein
VGVIGVTSHNLTIDYNGQCVQVCSYVPTIADQSPDREYVQRAAREGFERGLVEGW